MASLMPASASCRALAESPARREKLRLFSVTSSRVTMSAEVTNITIITMATLPFSSRCRTCIVGPLPIVPERSGTGDVEQRGILLVLDEELQLHRPRLGVVT